MKKLFLFLFISLFSALLFCEEIKVSTGDAFGKSYFDYFTPMDRSVSGGKTSVSSIKNVGKDFWCITIISEAKNTQFPKYYEYYVRPGDTIDVFRFPDITKEVKIRIKAISWNQALLEVVE